MSDRMLTEILRGTYNAQDCGYALQLQPAVFTNFRRDLTRTNALLFPRKTAPGPGGGEYRYTHLVEMAIMMSVGSARRKDLAKPVTWGLARLLSDNGYGLRKLNDMPYEERSAIILGGSDFTDADFPEGSPHDLAALVDYPTIYFDTDFISRDPGKPTFLVYDHATDRNRAAEVALVEDMTLTKLQSFVIGMRSHHLVDRDEHRAIIEEQFDDLPALNLTTMLNRIDERLALRLKAKAIRGG